MYDLWLLQTQPDTTRPHTYLQTSVGKTDYLMAFTSKEKAMHAAELFKVQHRAQAKQIVANVQIEITTIVCQVNASGVIVDYNPSTNQYAWLRSLSGAKA